MADTTAVSGLVYQAIDRAISVPTPLIQKHVDALRRRNPEASPSQMLEVLAKEYLRTLQAAGGAVGTAAAVPSVGTGVGMLLSASDVGTYFAASSAYALAVADIYGLHTDDLERRRALLLATVIGSEGAKTVTGLAELSTVTWGRALLGALPASTIAKVNGALSKRFIKNQLGKQTGLMFGRVLPLGIGAVVGVVGATALARTVIKQASEAFGPPPVEYARALVEPRRRAVGPARRMIR